MVKGWVEEWLSPPDELADAAVEPDVFSDYFLSLPNVKTQNGFKQYKTTYLGKLKDAAKEIETKQKIADIERGDKKEPSAFDKYVLELEPLMQEMGFNPDERDIQRWEAFRIEKSEYSKAKKQYEKMKGKRCTKEKPTPIPGERVTRVTRDTGGKKSNGPGRPGTVMKVDGGLYQLKYDDDNGGKSPKEEKGVPLNDVIHQTCQCSECTLLGYRGKGSGGKDTFHDNKDGKVKAYDTKENASFYGRRDKYLENRKMEMKNKKKQDQDSPSVNDSYPVNLEVPRFEPTEKIEYKPLTTGDSYDKEGAEMYCTLKKNIKLFPKYETQMLQFEKFKTIMRTNQAVDVLQLEYERIKEKDEQYKIKLDAQVQTEKEHEAAKGKALPQQIPEQIQELKVRLSKQKAETKQLELDGWEKNFLKKCAVEQTGTTGTGTAQKQSYDKFVFKTCCKEPLSCRPREDSDADCFGCRVAGSKKEEAHQTEEKDLQTEKKDPQTDKRPICTGNQGWKNDKLLTKITWDFPRDKSKMKNICKAILSEKRKVVVKLESVLTEPLKEYFGGRTAIGGAIDTFIIKFFWAMFINFVVIFMIFAIMNTISSVGLPGRIQRDSTSFKVLLKIDSTVTDNKDRFYRPEQITDVCQGLGWWMEDPQFERDRYTMPTGNALREWTKEPWDPLLNADYNCPYVVEMLANNLVGSSITKDCKIGVNPSSSTWKGDDETPQPILFQDQKAYLQHFGALKRKDVYHEGGWTVRHIATGVIKQFSSMSGSYNGKVQQLQPIEPLNTNYGLVSGNPFSFRYSPFWVSHDRIFPSEFAVQALFTLYWNSEKAFEESLVVGGFNDFGRRPTAIVAANLGGTIGGVDRNGFKIEEAIYQFLERRCWHTGERTANRGSAGPRLGGINPQKYSPLNQYDLNVETPLTWEGLDAGVRDSWRALGLGVDRSKCPFASTRVKSYACVGAQAGLPCTRVNYHAVQRWSSYNDDAVAAKNFNARDFTNIFYEYSCETEAAPPKDCEGNPYTKKVKVYFSLPMTKADFTSAKKTSLSQNVLANKLTVSPCKVLIDAIIDAKAWKLVSNLFKVSTETGIIVAGHVTARDKAEADTLVQAMASLDVTSALRAIGVIGPKDVAIFAAPPTIDDAPLVKSEINGPPTKVPLTWEKIEALMAEDGKLLAAATSLGYDEDEWNRHQANPQSPPPDNLVLDMENYLEGEAYFSTYYWVQVICAMIMIAVTMNEIRHLFTWWECVNTKDLVWRWKCNIIHKTITLPKFKFWLWSVDNFVFFTSFIIAFASYLVIPVLLVMVSLLLILESGSPLDVIKDTLSLLFLNDINNYLQIRKPPDSSKWTLKMKDLDITRITRQKTIFTVMLFATFGALGWFVSEQVYTGQYSTLGHASLFLNVMRWRTDPEGRIAWIFFLSAIGVVILNFVASRLVTELLIHLENQVDWEYANKESEGCAGCWYSLRFNFYSNWYKPFRECISRTFNPQSGMDDDLYDYAPDEDYGVAGVAGGGGDSSSSSSSSSSSDDDFDRDGDGIPDGLWRIQYLNGQMMDVLVNAYNGGIMATRLPGDFSGNIHWVGLDGSLEPSSEALRAIGMKGYDKPQGMYNWELVQSGSAASEAATAAKHAEEAAADAKKAADGAAVAADKAAVAAKLAEEKAAAATAKLGYPAGAQAGDSPRDVPRNAVQVPLWTPAVLSTSPPTSSWGTQTREL